MSDVYSFRFDSRYRLAALPFGVTPHNSRVIVHGDHLEVAFGLWRLRSALANVKAVETTGPFAFAKTAGPAHLSFADRGVTFATNGESGVCVRFHEPVPAIDPMGWLRHPGVTVTVADVTGLAEQLSAAISARSR